MDMLTTISLTVLASIAVTSIGFAYAQSRKDGKAEIPWTEIRPIISEMFSEVVLLMEARKEGYESIENYAVDYVKKKIDELVFLTIDEKALLSESLIRSIIGPRLREIYEEQAQKEG